MYNVNNKLFLLLLLDTVIPRELTCCKMFIRQWTLNKMVFKTPLKCIGSVCVCVCAGGGAGGG